MGGYSRGAGAGPFQASLLEAIIHQEGEGDDIVGGGGPSDIGF